MAEAPKKTDQGFDFEAATKLKGTGEVLKAASEIREARKAENERLNREYKFPANYNPNMGLKVGRVTELKMFYTVRPGHAEALKAALKVFAERETRNSKLAHLMNGIQSTTCTLFDNDTRYCHTAEFDTDWDPYIEDALPTDVNRAMYAEWMQHLEEAKHFHPVNNLPTANDIKVSFNTQRVTATAFIRTFGETVREEYKMRDLKKAFEEFLNHPDAAKVLEHPAMKPLLEFAAE